MRANLRWFLGLFFGGIWPSAVFGPGIVPDFPHGNMIIRAFFDHPLICLWVTFAGIGLLALWCPILFGPKAIQKNWGIRCLVVGGLLLGLVVALPGLLMLLLSVIWGWLADPVVRHEQWLRAFCEIGGLVSAIGSGIYFLRLLTRESSTAA